MAWQKGTECMRGYSSHELAGRDRLGSLSGSEARFSNATQRPAVDANRGLFPWIGRLPHSVISSPGSEVATWLVVDKLSGLSAKAAYRTSIAPACLQMIVIAVPCATRSMPPEGRGTMYFSITASHDRMA